MLQSAGIDACGLANVPERKWQVRVCAHELFGSVELVASGFLVTVRQSRVIVRVGAQEQGEDAVLQLTKR